MSKRKKSADSTIFEYWACKTFISYLKKIYFFWWIVNCWSGNWRHFLLLIKISIYYANYQIIVYTSSRYWTVSYRTYGKTPNSHEVQLTGSRYDARHARNKGTSHRQIGGFRPLLESCECIFLDAGNYYLTRCAYIFALEYNAEFVSVKCKKTFIGCGCCLTETCISVLPVHLIEQKLSGTLHAFRSNFLLRPRMFQIGFVMKLLTLLAKKSIILD